MEKACLQAVSTLQGNGRKFYRVFATNLFVTFAPPWLAMSPILLMTKTVVLPALFYDWHSIVFSGPGPNIQRGRAINEMICVMERPEET